VPFTGSHPAAVLPFFRSGLVPAALVIGSMVPDLPYYLPVSFARSLTHSLTGVIGIDLAMGLACFAVWVWLMEPAAVAVAGEPLRSRLPRDTPAPAGDYLGRRSALLVVGSVLLGAATHVVWDAFTHAGAWGPEHISWLAEIHGPMPGYRWLQYASGLLGAAVLIAAFARWWRRTPPSTQPGRAPAASPRATRLVRTAIVAAIGFGGMFGAWWGLDRFDGDLGAAGFAAATLGGACGAAVALCFAVGWKLARRDQTDL
jgi:hypothetical protein